jgi:hypothetical protein
MRPDANLRLPRSRSRLALVPGALLVGGLLTGAAVPSSGQWSPVSGSAIEWPSGVRLGYDRAGQLATTPCTSTGVMAIADGRCLIVQGYSSDPGFDLPGDPRAQVVHERMGVSDVSVLATYTDLRFEVWRATLNPDPASDQNAFALDPSQSRPFVTGPAQISGSDLEFRADLGRVRASRWVGFVTGVGRDGTRYRLAWPEEIDTTFTGTIWDWITASD